MLRAAVGWGRNDHAFKHGRYLAEAIPSGGMRAMNRQSLFNIGPPG